MVGLLSDDLPLEIERRFLASLLSPPADTPERIDQAYLSMGDPEIRVRHTDGRYIQTIKGARGEGVVGRPEVEFGLDAAVGAQLFSLAGNRWLSKLRYRMDRWEVDIFLGELRGLCIAEVELVSADERLPTPPAGVHLIQEVTLDTSWGNAALAALAPLERRALIQHIQLTAKQPTSANTLSSRSGHSVG